MVNTDEFPERIQRIIDYYELSASSFADSIGVQRSSISHILSGRNKPSLDFILKTIDAYPDVSLYWLLLNKGEFPPSAKKQDEQPKIKEYPEQDLFTQINHDHPKKELPEEIIKEEKKLPMTPENNTSQRTSIERVIIFFKDGSFKEYHN